MTSACALTLALALRVAAAQTPPAAQPETRDRPFADLFTNLARDIRALPSSDSALVLGVGSAGALLFHTADDNLASWAGRRGPSTYTGPGDFLGDGWLQAGVAVATYAIGVASRHPATTHIGSDLIRGQLLTGIATHGLKQTVNRRRPSGGRHSFPSGHTSAAFLSAAVLDGHFGWKVSVPAYAAAGFVGWSRLRDDKHWLSDVIVGGTIGTIVGRTVTRGHQPRQWAVVPSASIAGVGVFVVRR